MPATIYCAGQPVMNGHVTIPAWKILIANLLALIAGLGL